MKGIVFTEFLKMVDEKMSPEITERILDKANLPSGGAYTTVGTYDHTEIVSLVLALSAETGTPVPQLLHAFGRYLLGVFSSKFPAFFSEHENPLNFLECVDGYVHVEVRKLYPDAQLPRFYCRRLSPNHLMMDYVSERHLADLAHGLIEATVEHYRKQGTIARQDVVHDGKPAVQFSVTIQ